MSDSSRSSEETPGNAQRLLQALRGAASEAGTREALAEIGQRARGIVEELARSTRSAASAAASAAEAAVDEEVAAASLRDRPASLDAGAKEGFPGLHRRLDELRACLGEVTDVLEATVERLETVEIQLGDPRSGIERQLSEGIRRCERVLAGIEHRVLMAGERIVSAEVPAGAAPGTRAPAVMVVSSNSALRSRLCLALERQGFRALAATGLGLALRVAGRHAPAVALVAIDEGAGRADFLEDWKECQVRGSLPPALVLDRGRDADSAAAFGLAVIREEYGEAAVAASLLQLLGQVREELADT